MDLADRIRERLQATGLNPYSAAQKAGLGSSFVRDILRGKVKQPSAERLGKLAEALDTTLHFLLGAPEPQLQFADWRGNPLPPPPAPVPATPDGLKKSPLLLPVRHELYGDTFRKASDVSRGAFGYEAGTLPPAFQGRETWFELVADDSADLIAPKGSLVQVVAMADEERDLLAQDDIVIITKRHVGPDSAYHYLERSLRQVNERYPGVWFYEFAASGRFHTSDDSVDLHGRKPRTKDEWEGWEEVEDDDLPSLRELIEELPMEKRDALQANIDNIEEALKQARIDREAERAARRIEQRDPEATARFIKAVDEALAIDNRDEFLKRLEEHRKRGPKLAGKVIRVLQPVDPRAGFGF